VTNPQQGAMALQDGHFWLVVAVIILFGGLGGIVDYCLRGDANRRVGDKSDSGVRRQVSRFLKSLVVGVAGAVIVPLFLNMISSDLIAGSKTDWIKLLVLAGFCVVGGVYGQRFIASVSDRVLQDLSQRVDRADEKATVASKKADAVVGAESADAPAASAQERPLIAEPPLDDFSKRILGALTNTNFRFRTLEGLARDLKAPLHGLVTHLNALRDDGRFLVDRVDSEEHGRLWYATPKGREALSRAEAQS
jgi:hypothetical protein